MPIHSGYALATACRSLHFLANSSEMQMMPAKSFSWSLCRSASPASSWLSSAVFW